MINIHSKFALKAILLGAGAFLAVAANATAITSYTTTNVPASGFGGWSYDADTLNDGIIPTTYIDDILLFLPNSPTLTFTLASMTNVSTISILSAYFSNGIPGNITSARATIGASNAIVNSTGFGGYTVVGYQFNELFTLPGALSSIATTSFMLSDFVSDGTTGLAEYAALGEISVNGSTNGAVPEPASWAMMIAGFGLVGASMRRRQIVAA